MARIPILDENDPNLDPAVRAALVQAGQSRGRLVNVYRALANRPEALAVMRQLRRQAVGAHQRMRHPPGAALELTEGLRQPAAEGEIVPVAEHIAVFVPQGIQG